MISINISWQQKAISARGLSGAFKRALASGVALCAHASKLADAAGRTTGDNRASGGPDIGILARAGVPVVTPGQNGMDYFDYHHTPDDTFDKIDPAEFRQNVAVYAAFTYIAAETGWDFRKQPELEASGTE